MRFHEVQDYLSLTNHAYHAYAAVMNQDSWDSLPEDLQAVMLEAFDNGRDTSRALTLQDEETIMEEIKDEIAINELTLSSATPLLKPACRCTKSMKQSSLPSCCIRSMTL